MAVGHVGAMETRSPVTRPSALDRCPLSPWMSSQSAVRQVGQSPGYPTLTNMLRLFNHWDHLHKRFSLSLVARTHYGSFANHSHMSVRLVG
jgi:hypothetical protein